MADMTPSSDFYEDDEPVEKICRVCEAGTKGLTERPVSETRANNGYLRRAIASPAAVVGIVVWRSTDITTSLAH